MHLIICSDILNKKTVLCVIMGKEKSFKEYCLPRNINFGANKYILKVEYTETERHLLDKLKLAHTG